jgi:hypothetical protein
MDDADQPGPPDQGIRTTRRPPDPLLGGLRSGAARGGAAAARAARAEARVRLNAEGHRLHAEDLRLRAEREQGVPDRAAQARWCAALLAHREALRRFRGGA